MEQALILFNDEGVEKISTRHIAEKMQISVGNLHYHYANKIDVILKLQQVFIETSDELATKLANLTPDAETLHSIVLETFTLIYDYRFLFDGGLWLSRKIPEIKIMFQEMIEKRRSEFSAKIEWLKSEQLIRADLSSEQYDFLFYQIVILYNSWSSHISLLAKDQQTTEHQINKFAKIVSSVWIPYCTPKGLVRFVSHS